MAAAGEEAESSAAGERRRVPFARGGPVFVPFMVGPISTVPEFMSSALSELQSLRDELGDTGDEFDDELSVDELRVLSEEELVERALREAMEEGWDSGAPTQPEDQRFDGGQVGLDATRAEDSWIRLALWLLVSFLANKKIARKAFLRMSASSAPGNGTVTSSPSVERESSRSPIEGMAIVLHEPQGSNGKTRGGGGETRGRKGKTRAQDEPHINFSSCPALEKLWMSGCYIEANMISSQSLKRLTIIDCVFSNVQTRISIPSLVTLKLIDCRGKTHFALYAL